MQSIMLVAKKEVRDGLRDKFLLTTVALLLVLTVVSVALGSLQVHAGLAEYNKSVAFLKALGKTNLPARPNLNPIAVSKSFVNYVGMLGALLALVLGFSTITRERRAGTLKLILSRPVYRDQLLTGKLLGNAILLAAITLSTMVITLASLRLIGGVALTGAELWKSALFFLMTFLYMDVFLSMAVIIALLVPRKNNALLIVVVAWLVFAFVLPQIGDTMDMDNQLPGGFFKQIGMNKVQEEQVLSKFRVYEVLRDGVEELSPTKHYERISFGLLGVKPGFEGYTPLRILTLKWVNLVGLVLPTLVCWLSSYMVFLRRENVYA